MKRLKAPSLSHHVAALWVAILLSLGVTLYGLVLVLRVQSHQNDALSALICHAETQTRKATYLPTRQRERSIRFFERQIRLEHLSPCP